MTGIHIEKFFLYNRFNFSFPYYILSKNITFKSKHINEAIN